MLDFLTAHKQPVPSWLRRITVEAVQRGPATWMNKFLKEAIVYPGSGLDGSPIRQMAGVAQAFLFLDFHVGPTQIKRAIQGEVEVRSGLSSHRLLAITEFDPSPFLTGNTVQAPREHAPSQHSSCGLWAIFDRCDGGGRFAFMALGGEAINAISTLYPSTPPKGLVLQEHAFDVNPWGEWSAPLTTYAHEHWDMPPEWLILGRDRGQFSHPRGRYGLLGEDLAVESMHGSWREIYKIGM